MRIFDMLAHEGYHYELCKLKCDFTMIVDRTHRWNVRYRPIPSNVTFLDKSNLSIHYVERHDVAIIHNYKHWQLLRECTVPKIVVFHCSKAGQGDAQFAAEDLSECVVVFNSFKDKDRWDLKCPRQHVIWHGFDPNEWPISDRSINKVLSVGRRIAERDGICGYRIISELNKSGIPVKLVGDNPTIGIQSPGSFEELKEFHSRYAVYLNPTLRSPMPRGRGEAMMAGIPVITTGFYDEEMFIEHGVNGFVTNNIQEIKEYTALLLADKDLQKEMALASRRTAVERFHISRFLEQWKTVISEATQQDTTNISILRPGSPKVYVTKKDSSAGGGTISSDNIMEGLKDQGYEVKCLDINSRGWVSFVDGKKMPVGSARIWANFIKDNPCHILIFDDVDRYAICKEYIPKHCKVILCIFGNPQVHPTSWAEDGILNFDTNKHISAIVCRPIYARYLQTLFKDKQIVSIIGGCDGKKMRAEYGRARYKKPKDGALMISAHRGTDWWKNSTTAVLAAYGIYQKHPGVFYFKPSPNDHEIKMLKNVPFDIQYGGAPKEGMPREQLLKTMACAQLGLEPGYSEGFSRSCNEMMNLGVPVVQGPNASHIKKNKLLAEHLLVENPSDMNEVMEKSLALLENEDLWNRVSEECIQFSSQFNVEQEVETFMKVLEEKDEVSYEDRTEQVEA